MTLHDPLSKALLDEIEQQVNAECRAILTAGEEEAKAIVAAAHASARARMRDAILAMRREGSRRLRQAKAQRSTRERMSVEARMADVLKRATPRLADAVAQRWQSGKSRRLWIEAAARLARARLVESDWIVEHPPQWNDEDGRAFVSAAGAANANTIRFEVGPGLIAGLRVRARGAVLDATPESFLGDRPVVEAMLLAELAQSHSDETTSSGGKA